MWGECPYNAVMNSFSNADSPAASVFTKIIQGELPGVIVYEDELCVVLMDAFPMLPGHVLVIPRAQHVRIGELSRTTRNHLFDVASCLTLAMRDSGLSKGDSNIVINDGKYSGQSVAHVHIHVVPRNKGDGFPLPALLTNLLRKLTRKTAPTEELERLAQRLRASLSLP